MARHWFLSLIACVALLLAGAHVPAAAMEAPPAAPAASAEQPCHSAVDAAPDKPVKPVKADCCPTGCKGKCAPVAVLLGDAPGRFSAFVRAVVRSDLLTAAPVSTPEARERPPRTEA
jgi:hypothetical protein